MRKKLIAEFLGTLFLVCAVVGSGIMAKQVTGDSGLALLANTGATAAALFVLISILGPISGAHFNPVVSGVMWANGTLTRAQWFTYSAAQVAGAIFGVWLAHLMFELPVLQISQQSRGGLGQFLSEIIATFCLVAVILYGSKQQNNSMPALVALTIASAYWFTSSTSFANPAVTIARSLTNSFAGIAPANIALFIAAQCIGASLAWVLYRASD